MLIIKEGNAAVSAVESIAVIQRNSLFRTILQVPPLLTDRRVQKGIYIYIYIYVCVCVCVCMCVCVCVCVCVYVFALRRDRLSSVLKS
jgi:hypothetical protein